MTQFTTDQQRAISATGHDILVSASAGSGKTTVLVRRIIEKIVTKHQDITRLLIVTFTRAATAEMRDRISAALKAELTAQHSPQTLAFLRQQIAVATAAQISTLDAFSLQIVQRFYYVIGMDPNFRLLTDETERYMLQEDVWDTVREARYASSDPRSFEALTENFSTGHDDRGLQDVLFELIRYAQATTDPRAYLGQLPDIYDQAAWPDYFETTYWPPLREQLLTMDRQLEQAETLTQALPLPDWQRVIQQDRKPITTLLAQTHPDYASVRTMLYDHAFATWSTKSKGLDEGDKATKNEAKAIRDAVKTTWQKLLMPAFALPATQLPQIIDRAHSLMQTLSEVALEFWDALAKEKLSRHIQDYSDIAQKSLEILYAVDPRTGTQISQIYQAQFDEIMIDEYQDISPLQEALLDAISQDTPGDRFMVGDVKQSIYGFRLADPELFIQKYQTFSTRPSDPDTSERIILQDNFRSTQNVLNFTNLVFQKIMDQAVGGLDYGEAEALTFGANDLPTDYHPPVELLLFQQSQEETAEGEGMSTEAEIDRMSGQLRLVIDKIKTMISSQMPLYDRHSQTYRPITYRDITILTRTATDNATVQRVFAEADLPILVNDAKNFFKTTELLVMVALLQIVDNPRQEIPLVAILRSPIVGLTADQLALIRLADRQVPFYDAIDHFLATPGNTALSKRTAAQLQAFLGQLTHFRDVARQNDLVTLLWTLYNETGYLDYVGGTPGGRQRQANLKALITRARTYEEGGFKGLFAFIQMITTMQKNNGDLAQPAQIDPDQNAVSLMTIHKSKGLEFPVVFVLNVSKQFNRQDQQGNLILTPTMVGTKWLDPGSKIVYTLPQYRMAQMDKRRQQQAEEMRLLYVALTRAQQRLFVVGAVNEGFAHQWVAKTDAQTGAITAQDRLNATSYLDWIGPALSHHPAMIATLDIAATAQADATELVVQLGGFTISTPITTKPKTLSQPDLHLDLKEWFGRAYPFEAATTTTGFQSVSEIKRLFDDPDTIELITGGQGIANTPESGELPDPAFLSADVVHATDVGTATHLLLQMMPLTAPVTLTRLTEARDALVQGGMLEAAVGQRIPLAKLAAFFATPLGQAIQTQHDHLVRELPFSMILPADEIFAALQDDPGHDLLIHGIIDGYFETARGLTLFDYKTDYLQKDGQYAIKKAQLVDRYRGQLNLYQLALRKMNPKPIAHAYLVFLQTQDVVDLAITADK